MGGGAVARHADTGATVERAARSPEAFITLSPLQPATEYKLRLYVNSSLGLSPPSREYHFVTNATTPTPPLLYVTSTNATSVRVAWSHISPNGRPLSQVRIVVGEVGADTNFTVDVDGTLQATTLRGLAPGTEYMLRGIATNDLGNSQPGPPIQVATRGCAGHTVLTAAAGVLTDGSTGPTARLTPRAWTARG